MGFLLHVFVHAFVLAIAAVAVPADSMRKEPYSVDRPSNMGAVIGWINATTDLTAEDTNGCVYVFSMAVVGFDAEGNETLIAFDDYAKGRCDGGVFTRGVEVGEEGWFARRLPGEGRDLFRFVTVLVTEKGKEVKRKVLKLPTGVYPKNVLHVWGSQWPRASLPANIVRVETRVDCQCVGAALVQVGADYWHMPTSLIHEAPRLVEAGASRWASAAEGRILLVLGR